MPGADERTSLSSGAEPELATNSAAPSTDSQAPAEIAVLKQKVMTAVRSAITETMLERAGGRTVAPAIDLDFSMPPDPNMVPNTAASPATEAPPIAVASKPPLPQLGQASRNAAVYPRLQANEPRTPPVLAPQRNTLPALLLGGGVAALGLAAAAFLAWPLLQETPQGPPKGPPKELPKQTEAVVSQPEVNPAAVPAPPVAAEPVVRPASIAEPASTDETAVQASATPAPMPPSKASAPPSDVVTLKQRLGDAKLLLNSGAIQDARKSLLTLAAGPSDAELAAEVAFALARSHDRNFLAGLAKADAAADRAEAERWYRRWHELSIQAGTVSNAIPLERLLRSLN